MYKIKLDLQTVTNICFEADEGYESSYKEERIGLLFGEIKNKVYYVKDVEPYNSKNKTRTGISFNETSLRCRAKQLAEYSGYQWIGLYHTHVEVGGTIRYGISPTDKNNFIGEGYIELIATVWATNSQSIPIRGNFRLKGKRGNYRYLISGYLKKDGRINLIPVIVNS